MICAFRDPFPLNYRFSQPALRKTKMIRKTPKASRGILDGLIHILSPLDLDLEERPKRILYALIVIFTVPVLFLFAYIQLIRRDYTLSLFIVLVGAALTGSFVILRRVKDGSNIFRINLVLTGLLFVFLLVTGGPHGYKTLWLYVFPLVSFFMLGRREGLFHTMILFLFVMFFLRFQDYFPGTVHYDSEFKMRFPISLFLVGTLAYSFEAVRYKFQQGMMQKHLALEREKEKLSTSKKMAESANRAKSEFLANMSHELRTPLNHIIGFTELVVDKKFGDLNEIQEDYLNDALRSSNHLLSLINDILDLSKVESGKLELKLQDVNLKNLLEDSMSMVREKAMKHGIRLSMDMDCVPDSINGDERKLKQIMYNLLSNAMKFVPAGGAVSVGVRITDCVIRKGRRRGDSVDLQIIQAEMDGKDAADMKSEKCVEFAVSDTGIGIRPEDLERIFNRFEQADGSTTKRYRGTGLGLSLTRSLVELHGGRIWAESQGEGKGSAFYFIIPI
jgi:signal transduction histidine kinase